MGWDRKHIIAFAQTREKENTKNILKTERILKLGKDTSIEYFT